MNPLPILVVALVGFSLAGSARKSFTTHRAEVLGVIRAWRWRYLPGTIAAGAGVIGLAGFIEWLMPWTGWGWWHLLGGIGNPALGEVNLGSDSAARAVSTALAITFPLLLAIAAIRNARYEENAYRKGNQTRSLAWRARRALKFGLIHCLGGVPIYAGIAISASGAWLDFVYQRGYEHVLAQAAEQEPQIQDAAERFPSVSIDEATRLSALNDRAEEAGVDAAAAQHAAYNLIIIVIVEIFVLSSLGVV